MVNLFRGDIDYLLGEMTLEEKIAQMAGCMPGAVLGPHGVSIPTLRDSLPHGIGHISNLGLFGYKTPAVLAAQTNELQRYFVEETRLGIPAMFHNEALHGVVAPGFTIFPAPPNLAATFSPELVESMAAIISRQLRSVGFRQALAPVMDVARDARWGRFHETYGEDVLLVTAFSVAFTRGLQGDDLRLGVIATGKHFLAYAAAEAGQNMGAVSVGQRELVDVHGHPFEAAIHEAGLAGVMNSYSEVDGIPVAASRALLTTLLRGRMKFTGAVISDYHTVGFLTERNGVASDLGEAGELALRAGVDVELPTALGYGAQLLERVSDGRLSVEYVNRAARRVLESKAAVGLFSEPYVREDSRELHAVAFEGRELSRTLSDRAVTLLANDGILPLELETGATVAVLGPHASNLMAGIPNYTYPTIVEMLEDISRRGGESIAGVNSVDELFPADALDNYLTELSPVFGEGLDHFLKRTYGAISLAEALREALPHQRVVVERGTGLTPDAPTSEAEFLRAINAARGADVVILALGGKAAASGEYITEGEGHDSAHIDLPANQVQLARGVAALGVPTVACLFIGRPYCLGALMPGVSAVVTNYYGGPYAAESLAQVLVGDLNPSGRLPFSIPRSAGQLPIHYAQKRGSGYRRTPQDMHTGYVDEPATPLFPFGFGLSFTEWSYGELRVESNEVDIGGVIRARVTISNVGARAGAEVVQLYLSRQVPVITRPQLQLIAFRRVEVGPGTSVEVSFEIAVSQLAYSGIDGATVIDPGELELLVGGSSDSSRSQASVTLVGRRRVLSDDRSYLPRTTTSGAAGIGPD